MYTAEIFTRYINQIKSPEVKNIVKRGLAECDETFNEVYKEKGHYIACLIASHMGQWNVNLYSKTILPKPKTATQKFVHLCDYLVS